MIVCSDTKKVIFDSYKSGTPPMALAQHYSVPVSEIVRVISEQQTKR